MLTMEIKFSISGGDDALRAGRICTAIFQEYNGPEADVIDTPHSNYALSVPATDTSEPRVVGASPSLGAGFGDHATVKRARATKAEMAARQAAAMSPTSDLTAMYDQATGGAPPPIVEAEPTVEQLVEKVEQAIVEDKPPVVTAPSDTRTHAELIEAIRAHAKECGHLWMRAQLARFNVPTLNMLPGDAIVMLLAEPVS